MVYFEGNGSAVVYSLFIVISIVCVCFVFGSYFGMHYFVSFLVLQSSWCDSKGWLLDFYCLLDGMLLLLSFASSSLRCRLVYDVCLWYFLVILT